MAHQVGAYTGFCITKKLEVFLPLLGWDASTSQGLPPSIRIAGNHLYVLLSEERHKKSNVSPKNIMQCPGQDPNPDIELDPESCALTIRRPSLQLYIPKGLLLLTLLIFFIIVIMDQCMFLENCPPTPPQT